jgi:L-lactate dehydrogenase complex protein LldG
MANEVSSREEILRRVRAANGGASTEAAARAGWSSVSRRYKREGTRRREVVLELLEDRLRDYDAGVVRCERGDVARSVAGMLTERGRRRLVVPAGFAREWLPSDFEFVIDQRADDGIDGGIAATELDRLDGVLTGSTVAIAETGTVVLQNVAGQGRRAATLVPDYHLCLVRVEDVVETVPEAMDRLRATSGLATTFVSGPSATADIEMTRIKGVHGPRYLDVILIT